MVIKIIIVSAIVIGGLGSALYSILKKDNRAKTYNNLKHCKVPKEWEIVRDNAWERASSRLSKSGITPITKCKKIVIEKGIRLSPTSGQWGRPTSAGFWYAGLEGTYKIQIVGTPDLRPYDKSFGILSHEAGETILSSNKEWWGKTPEERNKFLWSIGL